MKLKMPSRKEYPANRLFLLVLLFGQNSLAADMIHQMFNRGICVHYASWRRADTGTCRFMNATWDLCIGASRTWGDVINEIAKRHPDSIAVGHTFRDNSYLYSTKVFKGCAACGRCGFKRHG